MINNLPAVQEKEVTVSEISLVEGVPEKKVREMMKRYDIDTISLSKALSISSDFNRSLHKACQIVKEHDGDQDVVTAVFDVCEQLGDISISSVSLLMKKFKFETAENVIEAIEEACQISRRQWDASTVLDLLHLAESNENIVWLSQLIDEFRRLKTGYDPFFGELEEEADE